MRKQDVAIHTDRCFHSLGWAQRFLELDEYTKSIQDSYFAAFYAAKAALIHMGIRSKSHRSVQDRIDDLVDDGSLLPDIRGVLQLLLARRNEAAYRVARGNWTKQEATDALRLAEKLVNEMERIRASPGRM